MIDKKLEEILESIKKTRSEMHDAINKEDSLLSPKVIYLSEVLDKLLNEYHRIQASKDNAPK